MMELSKSAQQKLTGFQQWNADYSHLNHSWWRWQWWQIWSYQGVCSIWIWRREVKYIDFDDAIDNDSLKFLDIIKGDKLESTELDDSEEESINSLEDYEMDLFYSSIKEKSGEE